MKRLGYLSAAPRVSTHPEAEASGPRSHVLGVICAFENLGWNVKRFIVGDRVPVKLTKKGSEKMLSANPVQTLLADFARILFGLINSRRAWKELGNQVDWVYERFAVLQSLGWIFKRNSIPWILETNGLFFEEAKKERKSLVLTGLARKIEIAAYQKCDVLVCVSESLKELVVQKTGIDPEKTIVVPNGVDTSVFDPGRFQGRRKFEGFTVGFVGSLIAWQGLDLLLKAIADLKKEGLEIYITVVGDGPAREEWEQLARELKLTEYVCFTGRVPGDQVPEYIAGFDVGFSGNIRLNVGAMYHSPLKLYEYMSMGKPVVASAFDDARKLVEGKNTGFLFTPGDLEDLKRALREAYSSRSSIKEMGRLAREEIVQNHSWESRVREMIPQIEEILGRKK